MKLYHVYAVYERCVGSAIHDGVVAADDSNQAIQAVLSAFPFVGRTLLAHMLDHYEIQEVQMPLKPGHLIPVGKKRVFNQPDPVGGG